ncbi:Rho GTPase-activating protein 18 [Acipenser ruthenus]|uniref:Rho GTPase-activating protein 18 n=1 Tax=Acipenser ruthenus TaxID=7906 RepID=A0A444UCI4_ACIRT|nr:Rho GTPase-activating protein 18 [Acipenser ruthenus]
MYVFSVSRPCIGFILPYLQYSRVYKCRVQSSFLHDILHSNLVKYYRCVFFNAYSRRTGQYNIHSRAKNAAGKPPYSSSSQDSLDELSMDDYWTELQHIQTSRGNDQEVPEEVLMKVPDGSGTLDSDQKLSESEVCTAAGLKEQSKSSEPHGNEDDSLLPNFKMPQDKTGTTKIGDLASQDMKKVRSLALIELTALYDAFGIDFKSHKAVKIKIKESGLFGVPLTILLEQDQKKVPGTKVPLILQKSLCQELEAKFYERTFAWDSVKQHDAASLLKFFIRELPQPLLTVEYLNAFITVQKLPTRKHQLQALNLLVLFLPEPSRETLKTLLEFLQRVIDSKEKNKMTLNNIAVIMAPNLFRFKGFRSKGGEQQEFAMAAGTANIMRWLIKYQNLLWLIPKFLMNQVRKQNTENQKKMSKDKAMKKLLKKMAYDREKHERPYRSTTKTDALQGVIRVQAPQFSKVSMAIQLTEDLKASDVLARLLSQIGLELL